MEKASSSSLSDDSLLSNLLDFTSLDIVFDLKQSYFFLSYYWSLFHSKFQLFGNSEQKNKKSGVGDKNLVGCNDDFEFDTNCLLGKDINLVMERLGIQHNLLEGEDLQKRWDYDELSSVFEEEPSFEEVKQAFDVFDQNKDGFIDAGELQRVLRALGLRQGSELQECNNMIQAFDHNKDGKIDFNEFVKFMLNTF